MSNKYVDEARGLLFHNARAVDYIPMSTRVRETGPFAFVIDIEQNVCRFLSGEVGCPDSKL
jgi:hypothetical protein